MEDYSEVCTRSYSTEAFDSKDSSSKEKVRGSLHGEVKIYTPKEVEEFNEKRQAGLI